MIENFNILRKRLSPKGKAKGRKLHLWVRLVILTWIFFAVFADQLANELPLSCTISGQRHFPAFKESFHKLTGKSSIRILYLQQKNQMEDILMPPVPYSPNTIDRKNAGFKSPFALQETDGTQHRHWLGTDSLGRDVLAGLIHGSRLALLISLIALGFALVIGIPIGAVAGYFGDRKLKVDWVGFGILVSGFFTLLYVLFIIVDSGFQKAAVEMLFLFSIILILLSLLYYFLKSKGWFQRKRTSLPVDLMVLRTIEIFRSLPTLFILLALLAIIPSVNILTIALIIGALMWPTFARYTRAEFLSLREKEFVSAAVLQRKSSYYIIVKEMLPNAIAPLAVAGAFGVSASILTESTLSFLGIGLTADQVSWGSMLNEARKYFAAWWIAVFPGVAIFIVVYSMNSLGDWFSDQRNDFR